MFITAKEASELGHFSDEQFEKMYGSELEKLEASVMEKARLGEKDLNINLEEYGFLGKYIVDTLQDYLINRGYNILIFYQDAEPFKMNISW